MTINLDFYKTRKNKITGRYVSDKTKTVIRER